MAVSPYSFIRSALLESMGETPRQTALTRLVIQFLPPEEVIQTIERKERDFTVILSKAYTKTSPHGSQEFPTSFGFHVEAKALQITYKKPYISLHHTGMSHHLLDLTLVMEGDSPSKVTFGLPWIPRCLCSRSWQEVIPN